MDLVGKGQRSSHKKTGYLTADLFLILAHLFKLCQRRDTVITKTEITKFTMREWEMEERGDAVFMRNEEGDVIKYRYDLVASHSA